MSQNVAYTPVSKDDGEENLIEAVAVPEVAPAVATRVQEFVQVCAPSTLAGGYELTVAIGGSHWMVLVPKQGVKEGELFKAEILRKAGITSNATIATGIDPTDPHNIPQGRWRDGEFDCCKFGGCHPLFCLATWCPAIVLGQVLYRMNLSITANPVPRGQGISPFKFMLGLMIAIQIVSQCLSMALPPPIKNPDGTMEYDPSAVYWNHVIYGVSGLLNLFLVYVTVRARTHIRQTYGIPQTNCLEDVCCSFCFLNCVVAQMARHTINYAKYQATCCTNEGVDERVPSTLAINRPAIVEVAPQVV